MEKSKKSQILKLILIIALLILTPLLSSSLRSKYLYFIVNILIIAVGAEAGLLSFFLESPEYKEPSHTASVAPKPVTISEVKSDNTDNGTDTIEHSIAKPVKDVAECLSENNFVAAEVKKVKKSPSTPSIFFSGGVGEGAAEAEELSEQDEELFEKAEIFIGNFYEQLKMQRKESSIKLNS